MRLKRDINMEKKHYTLTKKQIRYSKVKNVIDKTAGVVGTVLFSPIFLGIVVAIKSEEGLSAPVFFKQKRVGKNQKLFELYKFRTMKLSTPKDTPTHLLSNPEQYITKIGKFLRKSSLDELPQFLNIIKGDMAISGPRPALWNQDDLIEEREAYGVHQIKPGLTGWAQIHGRDELEIPIKARLDAYYLQNYGLMIDIKCFFGTIFCVLKGEGIIEGGTGKRQKIEKKENIEVPKKKILFVATVVRLHINMFHKPFIKWFHDEGWQVDVAANNDYENPNECTIPFCDNFYCLPFERSPIKKGNLYAYLQLKKIINEGEYDIIHCHTPMGGVVARLAAIQARKKGTKVIYTAHGFHFFKGASLVNWLVYYPVERVLSYYTDLLLTMNQEDYDNAQKFAANRTIKINGVGLDIDKFKACDEIRKEKVRKKLGLEDNDVFAISVAQLIPRKNHIVLIKAIAKLHNSKFHLFIVGDGVQERELKREAVKLGIRSQIHFMGFRKDVNELVSASDLFLFASLQEGLPVAVMEAMACGKPIIASRIRGNIDLIDEGKGGVLVEPRDVEGFTNAINYCLEKRKDWKLMANYNVSKIKHYSVDCIVEQMSKIYRSLF